jgi:hypothetical protein
MAQPSRTLLETTTSVPAADVLARAKRFFSSNTSIYAAFVEREGPQYVTLRGQGGEELIVHAAPAAAAASGTAVTGSSYLFDAQIARFFASLPPVGAAAEGV